jgi:hypothetical protein
MIFKMILGIPTSVNCACIPVCQTDMDNLRLISIISQFPPTGERAEFLNFEILLAANGGKIGRQ